jgi:hypothetical protein
MESCQFDQNRLQVDALVDPQDIPLSAVSWHSIDSGLHGGEVAAAIRVNAEDRRCFCVRRKVRREIIAEWWKVRREIIAGWVIRAMMAIKVEKIINLEQIKWRGRG